jgi:hypothetical protein
MSFEADAQAANRPLKFPNAQIGWLLGSARWKATLLSSRMAISGVSWPHVGLDWR